MNSDGHNLSEAGLNRSKAMLTDLKRAMVTLHKKRQRRKKSLLISASVLSFACLLLVFRLTERTVKPDAELVESAAPEQPLPSSSNLRDSALERLSGNIWIESEPGISAKYVIHSSDLPRSDVEYIADIDLPSQYARSGQAGFVALVNGKAILFDDASNERVDF